MHAHLVVHTPMEISTFDYYMYMHKSVLSMSSGKYDIKFKAYIMGSLSHLNDEMLKFFQINEIELIPTNVHEISSAGHARALNVIFKNFKEDVINVISDTDVVVCLQNFDSYIIEKLDYYDVIGTKYENIGGPCVEINYPKIDTRYQTYKNRPNLIWCAFSRRHNFSNLNVSAPNSKDTCMTIASDLDELIWGLPKGYNLWKDVGWEFPKYLFDREMKFSTFIKCNPYENLSPEGTLPRVLDERFKRDLPYQDAIYSEEYQTPDGLPFLIHQRGSRKRKFRSDNLSSRFYDAYERFVKNQNG